MTDRPTQPSSDERFVPATAMGRRYLEVQAEVSAPHVWQRGDRTAYQRALAQADQEDVPALARDFLLSVEEFAAYEPRREAFYDAREKGALDRWRKPGTPNTNRLAARLDSDGAECEPPLPRVDYVDRELRPSRTTSPSRFQEPLGTRIILDLLLVADSQPIVAEVKAVGDENAYYALIQALAACAQLAPQAQRSRLSEQYPQLQSTGPMQLWIVLASHNSRGRDKKALVGLTRDIAAELLLSQRVGKHVSTIACVDAVIPETGPVRLSLIWQHTAPT